MVDAEAAADKLQVMIQQKTTAAIDNKPVGATLNVREQLQVRIEAHQDQLVILQQLAADLDAEKGAPALLEGLRQQGLIG